MWQEVSDNTSVHSSGASDFAFSAQIIDALSNTTSDSSAPRYILAFAQHFLLKTLNKWIKQILKDFFFSLKGDSIISGEAGTFLGEYRAWICY